MYPKPLSKGITAKYKVFVPNAPFLYPMKTENRKVFSCFQGVEKGFTGNKLFKLFYQKN